MADTLSPSQDKSGFEAVLAYMQEARGRDNGEALSDADLKALSSDLWSWSEQLGDHERGARLRLRDLVAGQTTPPVLLEVVGPDIPFLVDSLLAICTDFGAHVDAVFHPVIAIEGDGNKSLIQIHLLGIAESEANRLLGDAKTMLGDLQMVVSDHLPMRKRMEDERDRLKSLNHLDEAEKEEAVAFLDWLSQEHFVFLGARTYAFEIDANGDFVREEPTMIDGSNLGLLKNEELNVLSRGAEPTVLTGAAQEFLQMPTPLIIAKSTLVSSIHRRVRADYVGVKHYDAAGRVSGETRFLGLFTAEAYEETARSVPVIRRRVAQIPEMIGVPAKGHASKALSNILENWPRDELFQTDLETLVPMVQDVLHLQERPRTRLFLRHDRFGRFVSAIVYVPRDAYDSDLRQRMVSVLETAYGAKLLTFAPRFSHQSLVRVLFQLELPSRYETPDPLDLERRIAALAVSWRDAFREELLTAELSQHARDGALCFRTAFNAAYEEAFSPAEALRDVAEFAELSAEHPIRMRTYREPGDNETEIRAKVYSRGKPLALSESVPVFENMGLFVSFETGYPVRPARRLSDDGPDTYWVHNVRMRTENESAIDLDITGPLLQDGFVAVWMGLSENDGFNRLILSAQASWREAVLMRGLAAYRRQSGLDPAMPSQIRALTAYPTITIELLNLFRSLFDPSSDRSIEDRQRDAQEIAATIYELLIDVPSLEDDRVLRRLCSLVLAIQRTNFFQSNHSAPLAFKVASRELEDLPKPKPFREIFVSSPLVDGLHLRFGPVARGGLRWTDRPNDFRTEVLGLVKAQQVKNAVIVPVGSKGGFFPKKLPVGGSREDIRNAGIEAYRAFISSLLSITDNLVDGDVHHPEEVVVHDGPDPYLVVAADKGTATFSDIANEISVSLGFWLGDAFASGGSAGYDHKEMGITARGGWEAVKRHFYEIGTDIQAEPFTVIGVGDMSGDVFGNGMLLSKQIQLIAAFNHLHVFVDPNPSDPERLWQERQRLFELPRSGWADYDTSLISEGGGVFERSAKSIELSAQMKAMSGLTADKVTPDEFIHGLLKSEADLIWFGGIGTYVKATDESHGDVGDRANDLIRVDAPQLKAKVIGEGANLGLTQAGRIEFAARGGRINTDAIDNSAGVDSSDNEVNIKILLSEAIRRGALPRGERNMLLASMTDDVAENVLAHNISQTGALTLASETAATNHETYERLMLWLEGRGVLDRLVEGLPSSEEMMARAREKRWLTRPELAVLLAWSKIVLFDDIVASGVPDDPYFKPVLESYFPEALGKYADVMEHHRLKREIIATVLANRVFDIGGVDILQTVREIVDADCADLVRGFEIARAASASVDMPARLEQIGRTIPAKAQTALLIEYTSVLRQMTAYIVSTGMEGTTSDLVARYRKDFDTVFESASTLAAPYAIQRADRKARRLIQVGATDELAKSAATFGLVGLAPRLSDTAQDTNSDIATAAELFGKIARQIQFDRLSGGAADALPQMSQWDRRATQSQIAGLVEAQMSVVRGLIESGTSAETFLSERSQRATNLTKGLKSLGLGQNWSFSKFSLAADMVRQFLS
ncbi:MAG: NAD-glutamate dehydrogenase [Pseudomonadota bacterium]